MKNLLIIFTFFFCQFSWSGKKPNIVFIMSDDMGYETLSMNGSRNFNTPNIDTLAKSSAVFSEADAMPLCCPTRTRLMSGQYYYRNYAGWNGRFTKTAPALGEMLKSAGYATGAFGKWHLGKWGSETKHGFDDFCLFNSSIPQKDLMKYAYRKARYYHNGKTEIAEYGPDLANKYALQFIDKNKDKTFFLYYTPWLAHNPNEPTPDSKDQNCTDWQTNFEDMVSYTDKLVGKVIAKLKEVGVYDNTMIIYTADNGTKTCSHTMIEGGTIFGGKGRHSVDGCHVPLIVKTDGEHQKLDTLIDFTDFYATFADWAGVKPPETTDGVSFAPVIKGDFSKVRPFLFQQYNSSVFVRNQQYKLYIDNRLYDIKKDPRESRPFYPENDSSATSIAREILKKHLVETLNSTKLAKANHRQFVARVFEKYKNKTHEKMLGSRVFEHITKAGRNEVLTFDISAFMKEKTTGRSLRFSRKDSTGFAALDFADVDIQSVSIFCGGRQVFEKKVQETSLTTAYKKKVINPMVDFIKKDKAVVSLAGLELPAGSENVELKVKVRLKNPGNQWGDRVGIFTYLK